MTLFRLEMCRVFLQLSGSHARAADHSILLLRLPVIPVLVVEFIQPRDLALFIDLKQDARVRDKVFAGGFDGDVAAWPYNVICHPAGPHNFCCCS